MCAVLSMPYCRVPSPCSVLSVSHVPSGPRFAFLSSCDVSCPCCVFDPCLSFLAITENPPLERFVIAMQLRIYQLKNENQFLPLGITGLDSRTVPLPPTPCPLSLLRKSKKIVQMIFFLFFLLNFSAKRVLQIF